MIKQSQSPLPCLPPLGSPCEGSMGSVLLASPWLLPPTLFRTIFGRFAGMPGASCPSPPIPPGPALLGGPRGPPGALDDSECSFSRSVYPRRDEKARWRRENPFVSTVFWMANINGNNAPETVLFLCPSKLSGLAYRPDLSSSLLRFPNGPSSLGPPLDEPSPPAGPVGGSTPEAEGAFALPGAPPRRERDYKIRLALGHPSRSPKHSERPKRTKTVSTARKGSRW